ncbi:hypothetical protein GCM10018952_37910 [Streptosporangium vulgare]
MFVEKVVDVVGLYHNPPERAVVLCVDGKSQIQALDRSQPVLPMMPGMPERRTHDYVRNGITSLFAAFDVADGTVIGELRRRHRAAEFKKFLIIIDKSVPVELDVHLICDNYGTHKTPAIKLSDDDEDFVVQTATTRPTKLGQPFTRWSLRKLVAYLRTVHGRVIRIGREALRGLLARRGVTFQRTKTWKESTDPDREAKLDRIEHVLDRFSPAGSSRSTSSAHSGSGPPQARAGPNGNTPTGCRPPTTAPMESGTSTAAPRSATTCCGASTAARKVPRTRWPRSSRSAPPGQTAPPST